MSPWPLNRITKDTYHDLASATLGIPDQGDAYVGQGRGKEVPTSSPAFVTHAETVITSIRAVDVASGLCRIPAGFYAVVHHGGLEWRTEHKGVSMKDDVVEWRGPIAVPSDPSVIVCLEVYASYEFQPTLSVGEQLRSFTFTGKQLLDLKTRNVPFSLFPKDGDPLIPCSSVHVTVDQRTQDNSSSSPLMVFGPHCSTAQSRGELEDATDRGHDALSRHYKSKKKQDLKRAVEDFERALRICPPNHPCRTPAQSNLALANFILFLAGGPEASLDTSLDLYCNVLAARPVGHPDRPNTLIRLAWVHFARYVKSRGDEVERTRATALLQEAMKLSPEQSHENAAATSTLQMIEHGVDHPRSAGPYSGSRVTDEDPWKLQWALGTMFWQRFHRTRELNDLENAISMFKDAVDLTPRGHLHKRCHLQKLGCSLHARYDRLGKLGDLEAAIAALRDAVDLTPHDHADRLVYLGDLGNAVTTRFGRLGELSDIEDGVSMLKDVVRLTSHGDPHKSGRLHNLARALNARYQRLGESSDSQSAISLLKEALTLAPHGDLHKADHLSTLSAALRARFNCLGELSDLESAISHLSDAVDLIPQGHPDRASRLGDLGDCFLARFESFGELGDLQNAISKLKDAVSLSPDGQLDKPRHISNLGNCLRARFDCLWELSDLEEALQTFRDALDLLPQDHRDKYTILGNLGAALECRFTHRGALNDLEDAILTLKQAAEHIPDGQPYKPRCLHNLGIAFMSRFQRIGQLSDLRDAIDTFKRANELTPHGHRDKPARIGTLASSLHTRFLRLGQLGDIQDAISMLKEAIRLTPQSHIDKPCHLTNLGNALGARFASARIGELSDLEDAISSYKHAIDLSPHNHPSRHIILANLAKCFLMPFQLVGDSSDFENAISVSRDTLDLTPPGHPDKPYRLGNVGNALRARFEQLGKLSDLGDAISMLKEAVGLTPHDHFHAARQLGNLGRAFVTRFEHLEQRGDLEDAISAFRRAVELTPPGHPNRSKHLNDLCGALVTRFKTLGQHSDMEDAITLYSEAASAQVGRIHDQFEASQRWVSCARQESHPSLLRAYSVAISLLPQLAWIGFSLKHRYYKLTQAADLAREAAAAALDAGRPEMAVEWLEQGRSVFWGELFQLRSSHEELSAAHPEQAQRLRDVSIALEHASVARERALSGPVEGTASTARSASASMEAEVEKHRELAIGRDNLLQEIRRFPGFERFLLQKEYSQLRAAAHAGPVVILNAAKQRCDALIVVAEVDHVLHVPLNVTFEHSEGFQSMWTNLLSRARVAQEEERAARVAAQDRGSWESLLSSLWNSVVKPVLDALNYTATGDASRIFWCPTGPFVFLPIHAAGLYGEQFSQPGHKVFDFVVSSYVPTLSILLRSSNSDAGPASGDLRLLAVRQPPSDGLCALPGVARELEHIKTILKNPTRVTLVEPSAGTVEEVLALMKEADWVHFACHGIQDDTQSGLCLADGRRLNLHDMIALDRPHGGLAFLSACQTATGEPRLSDEAIHIAAGMLFAGYGGVIGTMWSISDTLAPRVTKEVYEALFREGTPTGRPDYREAAVALHKAVGRLRERADAPFVHWLPFIHVGL